MIVVDPIYGQFNLPEPIKTLCLTPEVRRLSQIRLLNTISPSLATLGEIRRYSHTLGVLFLALQNQSFASQRERDAFAASVLLHDIGTPPFGHLLEYHLRERLHWSHESVIRRILTGSHVRENSAHQFFGQQTLAFRANLRKFRIETDLVEAIISGGHRLSPLLFGTLDLDNLDNVARMNWALGQLDSPEPVLKIAKNLHIDPKGSLFLPEGMRASVKQWLGLRKAAYEIIVFDGPTVAAQAILSEAIEIALDLKTLDADDWVFTDEELISRLMKEKSTKKMVGREYLGRLPEMLFALQVATGLRSVGFDSRGQVTGKLREILNLELGKQSRAYVFIDKGTFTKKVELVDPESGAPWTEGKSSESVLLYGFTSASKPVSHGRRVQVVQRVMDCLRLSEESIVKCKIGAKQNWNDAQQTLNIPA